MKRLLALAGALALLAGCAGPKPTGPARHLELSVSPASPGKLRPGTLVKVTVKAVPASELASVSGTVKVFGARTVPFKADPKDGSWSFKTQVPPIATVPPGKYEIKAWGRTRSGQKVEGSTTYEVH